MALPLQKYSGDSFTLLGDLGQVPEPPFPHLSNGDLVSCLGCSGGNGGMSCAIVGLHEDETPPVPRLSAQLSSRDPRAAVGLEACGRQEKRRSGTP